MGPCPPHPGSHQGVLDAYPAESCHCGKPRAQTSWGTSGKEEEKSPYLSVFLTSACFYFFSIKYNKMGALAGNTTQSNVQSGLEAVGRGKLTRQANEACRQGENSPRLLDFKPSLSLLDHLSWIYS